MINQCGGAICITLLTTLLTFIALAERIWVYPSVMEKVFGPVTFRASSHGFAPVATIVVTIGMGFLVFVEAALRNGAEW